jgi:hypothetical protein
VQIGTVGVSYANSTYKCGNDIRKKKKKKRERDKFYSHMKQQVKLQF